jgi:alpha-L-rhamnosidase
MECEPVISANAYFYDILGIMEKFANMNEDANFEVKMQNEKAALYDAFNATYLIDLPNSDHRWYGSQTATVMALQFEMVAKENIEAVVNGLVFDINEIKGGHHSVGIHGNRYIYTVLTKYGRSDLAHQILTTPEFPSQTYVMNYGFTTWPERQFEWKKMKGLTNSLNHPMHSGFSTYFYESIGGIKSKIQAPGYKEFTVDPRFPNQISQAAVSVPTPYGDITNNWNKKGDNFTMNLQIPFNTTGHIILTKKEVKSLRINGDKWEKFRKIHENASINNSTIILGSGAYQIEYLKY